MKNNKDLKELVWALLFAIGLNTAFWYWEQDEFNIILGFLCQAPILIWAMWTYSILHTLMVNSKRDREDGFFHVDNVYPGMTLVLDEKPVRLTQWDYDSRDGHTRYIFETMPEHRS